MTKEKRKSLEKSTQLNCVKNAKHWGDHAGSKPLFIIVNDDQRSFFTLLITILQFKEYKYHLNTKVKTSHQLIETFKLILKYV